jgi:hypothetical protein
MFVLCGNLALHTHILNIAVIANREIPVTWNTTSLFVDPISYVIKLAASPTKYNDIAPLMWNIAGHWCCAYPAIQEFAPPRDLAVEEFHIDDEDLLDLGLGGLFSARSMWRSF